MHWVAFALKVSSTKFSPFLKHLVQWAPVNCPRNTVHSERWLLIVFLLAALQGARKAEEKHEQQSERLKPGPEQQRERREVLEQPDPRARA